MSDDGKRYYRRLHPYSAMLLPTTKDDPQGFAVKHAGCIMRRGDRDIAGRVETTHVPSPWYPYDEQYEPIPVPKDALRLLEGMQMLAMKMYGVVPPDAEPVFLSQDQMAAAGLYHMCDLCQALARDFVLNVNARWPEEDQGMSEEKHVFAKHYDQLRELRTSAETGCHLCSVLHSSCRGNIDEVSSYEIQLTPTEILLRPREGIVARVWVFPIYYRPLVSTALTCHKTDALPVLEQAKKWLQDCTDDHEYCGYTELTNTSTSLDSSGDQPQTKIPFRLIEITRLENKGHSIRLATIPSLSEDVKYLTLSHCWGGADIIKLTQASMPHFQVNIPMDQLPKNFSEAIFVTSSLDFKYIWIDSLCIIQDSTEDWRLQAQQMGRIYWYSQCTIAALMSHDPNGGLFSARPMLAMNKCMISKDGGNAAHNKALFTQQRYFGRRPLHTRGWVVQERYLSRRTLNFGEDMVTWNCVTACATEIWPQFDLRVGQDPASQLYEILQSPNTSHLILEGHWIAQWWDLVEEYTGKSLTFESDRFPAIEGLARIVQEARQIPMVHGLWLPYLVNELLWSFDMKWDAPAIAKSDRQNESPSWSWISTDQAVRHYDLDGISYRAKTAVINSCQGFDGNTEVPVQIITGEMGRIIIASGPMLKIQHTPAHAGRERMSGQTIQIYPFRLCDGRNFPSEQEDQYWDGHWKPDITPDPEWDLYAVELIQRRYRDDHTISMGLILFCHDEKQRTYARIGMYEIEWGTRPEGWRELNGMELGYKIASTWEERDGERWFGENLIYALV